MTACPARISLDSLLFFEAAMRHVSFAGAADELNVTPSAVSQRIKSLEQALGIMLFERQPQGLKSTEAAQLYLLEIRPAIERLRVATLRATRADGRTRHSAGRRRLSIDMLPALASLRVLPKLRRFEERFPDVDLTLRSSFSLSDPTRDGFDCCIRYGAGSWSDTAAEFLADEFVIPVVSPDLMARQGAIENIKDLCRFSLINDFMPVGWSEYLGTHAYSESARNSPTFNDSSLAIKAAVDGLGVALGRSRLVGPEIEAGNLVTVPLRPMASPFSYWLIRPNGRSDPLVDAFASWLRNEIFETPPDQPAGACVELNKTYTAETFQTA